MDFSNSSYLFLAYETSNCEDKVLRVSILIFLNKLPISALVTPTSEIDLTILEEVSLVSPPTLEFSHE